MPKITLDVNNRLVSLEFYNGWKQMDVSTIYEDLEEKETWNIVGIKNPELISIRPRIDENLIQEYFYRQEHRLPQLKKERY